MYLKQKKLILICSYLQNEKYNLSLQIDFHVTEQLLLQLFLKRNLQINTANVK